MTVRRAKISSTGLETSIAGVDVTTANFSQKTFSATCRSIPILRNTSPVSLNPNIGATTSIYYGKTFTRPPMSAVFLSPTYPNAYGPYYMVSGARAGDEVFYMIDWALNSGGYVGAATGVDLYRRTDRIDLTNWQSGDSATTLYGFQGWAWAVVFDYE